MTKQKIATKETPKKSRKKLLMSTPNESDPVLTGDIDLGRYDIDYDTDHDDDYDYGIDLGRHDVYSDIEYDENGGYKKPGHSGHCGDPNDTERYILNRIKGEMTGYDLFKQKLAELRAKK